MRKAIIAIITMTTDQIVQSMKWSRKRIPHQRRRRRPFEKAVKSLIKLQLNMSKDTQKEEDSIKEEEGKVLTISTRPNLSHSKWLYITN